MPETQSKLEACASLIREHREMEKLLETFGQTLAGLNPEATNNNLTPVRDAMAEITPEMNTHFACEEQVLFRIVSPYHPMVLMEVEHEELMAMREGILELLDLDTPNAEQIAQLQEIGHRFINEMYDHIGREDVGIFPTCERALSDDEKRDVIEGMDEIRRQARVEATPVTERAEKTFEYHPLDLTSPPQRALMSQRLFENNGSEAKHITIRGGEALSSHWTPKQGVLICLQGEGVFTANEQEKPLVPGTVITMSPQLLHGVTAKTNCHLLLVLQNVD